MTPELIATIGTGIVLAAVLVPAQRAIRRDLAAFDECLTRFETNVLNSLDTFERRMQNHIDATVKRMSDLGATT